MCENRTIDDGEGECRFRVAYGSSSSDRVRPRLCQNARHFGSTQNTACQNAPYRPRGTTGGVKQPLKPSDLSFDTASAIHGCSPAPLPGHSNVDFAHTTDFF